jgi:hypothetical protein
LSNYVIVRFDGSPFANLWVGTGTKTFRKLLAQLNFAFSLVACESLFVGVGNNELDPGEPSLDHSLNGVIPPAANTNDFYIGSKVCILFEFEHISSPGNLS